MRIAEGLRAKMLAWVLANLPEEACGLVGGRAGEALLVFTAENELHSPRRFRMRPTDQLRGFRLFEEQGLELLAIFHSHPAGPPGPSPTDIAEAYYPETLTLIWSPGEAGWTLRAYRVEGRHVMEVPLH